MKKRMKNLKKKMLALFLSSTIIAITAIPASAANISFAFNLKNTGTSFNTYTGGSNTKTYSGDSASVRTYSSNAPGAGFAYIMQYKSLGSYKSATVSSPLYWLSGAGIVHPAYASGQNKTNRAYYVAARIDNDYNGTYSSSGYFNSDYVD